MDTPHNNLVSLSVHPLKPQYLMKGKLLIKLWLKLREVSIFWSQVATEILQRLTIQSIFGGWSVRTTMLIANQYIYFPCFVSCEMVS